VHLGADGPGSMRLNMPLAAGTGEPCASPGTPVPGPTAEVTLDDAGAAFRFGSGRRPYV
jgi:hypothetical protein